MFDIERLGDELEQVITGLDPTALDPDEAVRLIDTLGRIERLAAAGTALVATQIEATGAWRGTGARDAVGFVSRRTATSRARVRDGMSVAASIATLTRLGAALRTGDLSIDQAADIAAAAREHPEAEAELVSLASTATRRQLKARCLEILAEGEGAEEQHRRARAERSASSSTGRDGIWRFSVRLPVIDGATVERALDHFQTEVFEAARGRGESDPYDAYRADALVAMARAAMGVDCGCGRTGETEDSSDAVAGFGPAPDATTPGDSGEPSAAESPHPRRRRRRRRSSSIRHAIVVTVPHTTFLTGRPVPGEPCQVPGVGPVPVSVVHQLMQNDPIIKAVVTNGRDITATATVTRTIKEDLRLAVLAAHDLNCAVPDCDNSRFLELDHAQEFAAGGPTAYENLRPLCSFHHHQRTREGYELRNQRGSYEWVHPDGTVLCSERSADITTPISEPLPRPSPTSQLLLDN